MLLMLHAAIENSPKLDQDKDKPQKYVDNPNDPIEFRLKKELEDLQKLEQQGCVAPGSYLMAYQNGMKRYQEGKIK